MKTSLFFQHKNLKAKIVKFGDWELPMSYSGSIKEHEAVRSKAGLFDVSHMGEVLITGKNSLKFLNQLTINDVSLLSKSKGQYTAICNESGGIIDDLILYCLDENKYFMCINASNINKDLSWIMEKAKKFSDVFIENQSNQWSQIAIQGPNSRKILGEIYKKDESLFLEDLAYTNIIKKNTLGSDCLIARTGYTGELGYEIYSSNSTAEKLWTKLLEVGKEEGLIPCGLGARDSLRLESCYLLYGNDINEKISPLEAGISWATKLDKEMFFGKEELEKQKKEDSFRRLKAFLLEDKGIARSKMRVLDKEGKEIGKVTSGAWLPSIKASGGLALLSSKDYKTEQEIYIDIRGKHKKAKIVKKPLYKAKVHN